MNAQLQFIGTANERDIDELPPAMRDAVKVLRAVAHCGMPFAYADGHLSVNMTLIPRMDLAPYSYAQRNETPRVYRALIYGNGSVIFQTREEN